MRQAASGGRLRKAGLHKEAQARGEERTGTF